VGVAHKRSWPTAMPHTAIAAMPCTEIAGTLLFGSDALYPLRLGCGNKILKVKQRCPSLKFKARKILGKKASVKLKKKKKILTKHITVKYVYTKILGYMVF